MLCGYTPFWDSGSPMRIYENILKGKVKYPAYVNADAQNLLERLITADLTKRLGNLYGGPNDVKNHPWFAEVTWDRLARKDIDAPYTPPVKAGTGDASQFDRYAEDPDGYGHTAGGADEYVPIVLTQCDFQSLLTIMTVMATCLPNSKPTAGQYAREEMWTRRCAVNCRAIGSKRALACWTMLQDKSSSRKKRRCFLFCLDDEGYWIGGQSMAMSVFTQ